MSEDSIATAKPRAWYRQKVVLFVSGSILIAIVLVMVSLALYASSGAAQLDLSRPGYKSVQSKIDQTRSFESFPASGPVNRKVMEDFEKSFERQIKSVDSTDAFSPDALEDQSLGIDAPPAGE